jgi:RNA-dependent RNA polymerase
VELTSSQKKITYPSGVTLDPAHCVIDVLRPSHVKSPCRLSGETIVNLSENGVPKKVFLDLVRQGIKELVEPLLEWEGPDAMRNLWCNMRKLGGVMSARRAREDAGRARVKGYSEYESDEIELEDEEFLDTTDLLKSSAWWVDEISGCPSSLEETVMCLIDSGFTPQNCPVLRSKLEIVVKGYVKHYIKSYRIDVPMSATAYLIPGK